MKSISASIPTGLAPDEASPFGQLEGIDWSILVSTLMLAGIGLATVHSATANMGGGFLTRQAVAIGIGFVLMLGFFVIDYHKLMDWALPLYVIACVTLLAVLFIGQVRGGARSWLGVGPAGFQPSEPAKLLTAIFLCRFLANVNRPVLSLKQIVLAIAILVPPVGLVMAQPDYGTAAMFMPILAGSLLIAGIRWKVIIITAMIGLAGVAGVWFFFTQDYQKERVETFLNPESDPRGAGYQVRQSKIAVGSGEVIGKGYMEGTQSKLQFLPARHTDFIFAVLAEEWGFLGVILVLLLYGVYIVNGARVAMRARDREGILLVISLLSLVAFHVLYNTAMVVGLLPITGIPLPYLSYGGTFTLLNFAITGLILSVDVRRYVNR
jgi:rod shape determining protein RodA